MATKKNEMKNKGEVITHDVNHMISVCVGYFKHNTMYTQWYGIYISNCDSHRVSGALVDMI